MRLKSRNKQIPGGFQFTQPQVPNWHPKSSLLGFHDVVVEIIAMRKMNPRFNLPTDYNTVADELDEFNATRLASMKGCQEFYRIGVGEAPTPPKPQDRPTVLASAVAVVKRSHAGIKILLDWLGEGMEPVASGISASRAMICSDCPQNKPANILQKLYSRSIEGLALMSDFKAITPLDEKLLSCQACDCDLRFKVHTPMKTILKYTTDEIKARLDARCWILKL